MSNKYRLYDDIKSLDSSIQSLDSSVGYVMIGIGVLLILVSVIKFFVLKSNFNLGAVTTSVENSSTDSRDMTREMGGISSEVRHISDSQIEGKRIDSENHKEIQRNLNKIREDLSYIRHNRENSK